MPNKLQVSNLSKTQNKLALKLTSLKIKLWNQVLHPLEIFILEIGKIHRLIQHLTTELEN